MAWKLVLFFKKHFSQRNEGEDSNVVSDADEANEPEARREGQQVSEINL